MCLRACSIFLHRVCDLTAVAGTFHHFSCVAAMTHLSCLFKQAPLSAFFGCLFKWMGLDKWESFKTRITLHFFYMPLSLLLPHRISWSCYSVRLLTMEQFVSVPTYDSFCLCSLCFCVHLNTFHYDKENVKTITKWILN